jgi:hypothetical protein
MTGVADGIRTHNNWNHKAAAPVVPISKSKAYPHTERLETVKNARKRAA